MSDTFDEDRERMVAAQLAARGIADGRVLEAMRRVPRHLFVDPTPRALLGGLGYLDRVTLELADGTLGWPAAAPYDAIIVTAAAPQIPRPLIEQLGPGGRLVLPMGEEELQGLVRIRRGPDGIAEEYL